MSEALLQAVLDYPELDEPRVAYAAWCDEQPDDATRARAEFIRAQIAIHNTDLETLNRGGGVALQNRVDKLRETYGAAWTTALSPFVQSCAFQRGFVGQVQVSARSFMDNSTAIFAAAPVRHLDLTGVRDVREDLFASQGLARLLSLSMDGCGLYDFHLRLLSATPLVARMRWLSVADNHLELGGAEAIAASPHFKQLRYAEFRGNPVDPCEQLGWDAGVVVSAWLPPEGESLEARYGPLAWLHRDGSFRRYSG
jgi:uncharacterized protein (TIGR02996 family)